MSEPTVPESEETKAYNSLVARKATLEDDLKTITNIYGKVTSSHDYKEFAAKINHLLQKVQSQLKELNAKTAQWDAHFKAQAAYQEMLKLLTLQYWNMNRRSAPDATTHHHSLRVF